MDDAVIGADALPESDLSFDNSIGHTAKGVYDPGKDTLIPFDPNSRTASIDFALAAATESKEGSGFDTLAAGNRGVGLFQFYAEVNTYAPWKDGDIEVNGVYTITPLRRSTYEKYFSDNAFTEGGWGTQLKSRAADSEAWNFLYQRSRSRAATECSLFACAAEDFILIRNVNNSALPV